MKVGKFLVARDRTTKDTPQRDRLELLDECVQAGIDVAFPGLATSARPGAPKIGTHSTDQVSPADRDASRVRALVIYKDFLTAALPRLLLRARTLGPGWGSARDWRTGHHLPYSDEQEAYMFQWRGSDRHPAVVKGVRGNFLKINMESQRRESASECCMRPKGELFNEEYRVLAVEDQSLTVQGVRSGEVLTIVNQNPETPLTPADYPPGGLISLSDPMGRPEN